MFPKLALWNSTRRCYRSDRSGSRELCVNEIRRFVGKTCSFSADLSGPTNGGDLWAGGQKRRRPAARTPHGVHLRLCRRAVQLPQQWPPSSCGEHASILDVFNYWRKKRSENSKKGVIGGGFYSPGSEKEIVKSTESYVLLVFSQKHGRMIEDLCSIIWFLAHRRRGPACKKTK